MPAHVPGGYEVLRMDGAVVVALPEARQFVEAAIREQGSLHAFATHNAIASMTGRSMAHVIDSPGGTVVVRHYTRGGAVAVLGDRYLRLGGRRPRRELWISAWARARGVSTPAVVATVTYGAGLFYRGDIATAFVPEAATLADCSFGPGRGGDNERMLAWHAAGRLLRSAAQAGLIHADLNLRNILAAWRAGLPTPYLLDLDRCRIVHACTQGDLARMTRRLRRSAAKFEQQTGQRLTDELPAFEAGLHA